MMKKLILGLVAVFVASGASAQLDFHSQTVKTATPAAPSMLSGVLGSAKAKVGTTEKSGAKFKTNYLWNSASQMVQMQNQNISLKSANAVKVAKAEKAATAPLSWFSYMNSSSLQVIGFSSFNDDLLKSQTKYNIACIVPANYTKAKIDSVEFYVFSGCTYENLTVWASPIKIMEENGQQYYDIPESADDAEVKVVVPADSVKKVVESLPTNYVGPVGVKLPTPLTVSSDGAFVGYSFDSESAAPVVLAGSGEDGGLLFQYEYEGHRYFQSLATTIGMNSTIMVGMDTSDCEANSASVSGSPETTALVNTDNRYNFYITNNSAKPITDFSYVLSYDGEEGSERTVTLDTPIQALSTVSIPAAGNFEADGVHYITLTVTKVNGNENLADDIEATNTVVALEKAADRVMVVEEQTGVWCGWCPRGHVALRHMNDDFGDKIITLAGHFTTGSTAVDPMNIYQLDENSTEADALADYGYVTYNIATSLGGSGFPGAMWNRMVWADPYVGSTSQLNDRGTFDYGGSALTKLVNESVPSEADFSMTASWADDTKNAIKVDLSTTFNYDRFAEFPYGVAFVLSENDMKSATAAWRQANYFSSLAGASGAQQFDNPDMAEWLAGSSYVRTTYDNVVVQSWNPLGNTALVASQTSDIEKGKTIPYSVVLNVNSNLIQDKDKLTLSALLVNLNSFAIVNAAKVFLSETAAGIKDVDSETDNTVVSRYNVNGMRLNGAQKGLNIVKLANGRVVKMLNK